VRAARSLQVALRSRATRIARSLRSSNLCGGMYGGNLARRIYYVRRQSARMRTASCSCASSPATVVGDPVRVSVCHCLACQRRTGSVLRGAKLAFQQQLSLSRASPAVYVRTGDSGGQITSRVWPTVFYTLAHAPELIAIPVEPSPTSVPKSQALGLRGPQCTRGWVCPKTSSTCHEVHHCRLTLR